MKAICVVRGYVIYAKSNEQNHELYDFFYPNTKSRITITEAENLLPDGHKLLTTERQTRYYEIDMQDLNTHGKILH